MNNRRTLFLKLMAKRSRLYRDSNMTIIERKIDKLLKHQHIIIESVGDVTKNIDVPYALIGGHAVTIHGSPRMTEDIDIITKKEYLDSIINSLDLNVRNKLTIGGVAAKTVSGFEIDVITPDKEWVDGLLRDVEDTKYGKVVSKPYLVLTKIWSSRSQDDLDIIKILKKMTDDQKEETLSLIRKYFPNYMDDVESMIEISKYDIDLS